MTKNNNSYGAEQIQVLKAWNRCAGARHEALVLQGLRVCIILSTRF